MNKEEILELLQEVLRLIPASRYDKINTAHFFKYIEENEDTINSMSKELKDLNDIVKKQQNLLNKKNEEVKDLEFYKYYYDNYFDSELVLKDKKYKDLLEDAKNEK